MIVELGCVMDLREETIESVEAFTGSLVKLRVDRVRLPNGKETIREIVVHRGAVALVPMIDGEKIIMIRQFRQAAGEVLFEIPAGTLEPNEDPLVCAQRELCEETGYLPGKLTLMFKSYLAPGYSSEMLYTYLAENIAIAEVDPEEDEFIEIIELSLSDAVDMISKGEIKDAKTICGLLMAQKILASR